MKKRVRFLIVLAVLLALAVAAMVGIGWVRKNYVMMEFGDFWERDMTRLDLRGAELPEMEKLLQLTKLENLDIRDTGISAKTYEEIRQGLPECEILWSVPFQGGYVENTVTELTVTELSQVDMQALLYLPDLEKLNADGCRDFENLMVLQETNPGLEIHYTVQLVGQEYDYDTTELDLKNADPDELEQMLPFLPALTKVTFSENPPDGERISQWMVLYPQIQFIWSFEVCGVPATSLDTELILNEIPMESVEEVENALKCFYNLQRVEMCDCGIPSEEMDALWKRHPETRFVWAVWVGKCHIRTDETTFMPYKFGYGGTKLYDEDLKEMKYCVDMIVMDLGHMGITDYSFLSYLKNVKYLILADTRGDDFSVLAEMKELVFLEIFMTSFDQAEVLTGLTKLEDLNIGTSHITNVKPLMEMTWLKNLWLPANIYLPYEQKIELQKALPDTHVNYLGSGSTGNGWRQLQNYYDMRDLLGMWYSTGW